MRNDGGNGVNLSEIGEETFRDLAVEVAGDGFDGLFKLLGLGVDKTDTESLLRKNMCYAIAHRTGPDDGDLLHDYWEVEELFRKSPLFQAWIKSAHARGLRMFCGGAWP